MAWITPKIDWLSSDYMNFADFNRIENNIAEVVAYLNSIQYTIPAQTSVTSRTKTYIDFLSSINRIEANLEAIKVNFITPVGYLPTESWDVTKVFDYADANRLENNVRLLHELGFLVFESYTYCGTFSAGEDGVIY